MHVFKELLSPVLKVNSPLPDGFFFGFFLEKTVVVESMIRSAESCTLVLINFLCASVLLSICAQ